MNKLIWFTDYAPTTLPFLLTTSTCSAITFNWPPPTCDDWHLTRMLICKCPNMHGDESSFPCQTLYLSEVGTLWILFAEEHGQNQRRYVPTGGSKGVLMSQHDTQYTTLKGGACNRYPLAIGSYSIVLRGCSFSCVILWPLIANQFWGISFSVGKCIIINI